jgi:hypothetical protein
MFTSQKAHKEYFSFGVFLFFGGDWRFNGHSVALEFPFEGMSISYI